jgi:hypothetical protein
MNTNPSAKVIFFPLLHDKIQYKMAHTVSLPSPFIGGEENHRGQQG